MSIHTDIIGKLASQINNQKEQIIKNRLLELGFSYDYELEKTRRFKMFLREIEGNEERYYYNDGTIEGRRIVTFVKNDIPFNMFDANRTINIGYEESYY